MRQNRRGTRKRFRSPARFPGARGNVGSRRCVRVARIDTHRVVGNMHTTTLCNRRGLSSGHSCLPMVTRRPLPYVLSFTLTLFLPCRESSALAHCHLTTPVATSRHYLVTLLRGPRTCIACQPPYYGSTCRICQAAGPACGGKSLPILAASRCRDYFVRTC